METKTLRCTYCGARLPFGDTDKVTCPYCDSVNYLRFAEKAGKGNADGLKNLRERLYECVNARYHDFEEMKFIADEILNISGYDFEAKYFYALALKKSGKRNKYLEFLTDEKNLAPNERALELVMNNVIRYAKENERSVIRRFVDINVKDELARLEYIDRADRQIERAARYHHGGQDVFVCHRSSDGAIAETVVARLEAEGISCFISERNLEDLEIGEKFERALSAAIDSTKLFLLISSYSAFDTSSENYVLYEIGEAKRLKKPNAEFRIQEIDRATESKAGDYAEYFDGCQYIDAYPTPSDMLDRLALQLKEKLDRIDKAGSPDKYRESEREREAAEMAAEIERLKAEKAEYEKRLMGLGKGEEKPVANTDTERSETGRRDAVFGFADEKAVHKIGGEANYMLALDYEYGRNGKKKDKAKAVYYYTKAAEEGSDEAMLSLGVCYEYGDGIKKNYAKAVALYVSASERGNAKAQCNLGYCYFNGVGVGKDIKKAVLWYDKAAKSGNVRAMNNLGYCYENAQGVPRDLRRAFELYKAAADGGDTDGACNVGWCYETGIGTRIDLNLARQYNALAKESGSFRAAKAYERIESKIYACAEEAERLYERGLACEVGDRRSSVRAAGYYKKAAKAGSVRAVYNLGVFSLRGDGMGRDEKAAFEYFSEAAKREHLGALYNLGYCYEKGVGCEKDLKRARSCYERAAKGGQASAQYAFASFFENGVAGEKDPKTAEKWYRRAAKNGNAPSMVALGVMYGARGDREKAKEEFKRAADAGDETGMYNYGCILRNEGDNIGARETFALAANKGYTPAMFNLGKMAEDAGNRSAAEGYYRMGADKDDPACIRALELLSTSNV
ncbi:MAG: TIR domain-containing protein [Clostridia bacterium]|nr:TIR domain-containing protein [Clostridia bacterium]